VLEAITGQTYAGSLSPLQAWQSYCTESLHPLGHPLTSEMVLMTAIKQNCTLQMVILCLHIIIPNTCNEHNPPEIKGRTQRREGVK